MEECIEKLFEPNIDIDKNAYLNWRFEKNDSDIEKFIELSYDYFDVSMYLIDETLKKCKNNDNLDGWIFPILFDIYQGMELSLKAYNKLLYPDKKIKYGGHNIISLSYDIEKELTEKLKNDKSAKKIYEDFLIIKKFIKTLYDNTSNDETYVRYPKDKNLNDFFYIGGREKEKNGNVYYENIVIDVEKLKEIMPMVKLIFKESFEYFGIFY